jgi:hypothetical protein
MGNITHKQVAVKYFCPYFSREVYLYLAIPIVMVSFIIHTFTLRCGRTKYITFVTFRAA